MNSSLYKFLHSRRELVAIALTSSSVAIGLISRLDASGDLRRPSISKQAVFNVSSCACDSVQDSSSPQQRQRQDEGSKSISMQDRSELDLRIRSPSLWRRLLAPIGISFLPRLLTPNDPAFKISRRFLRQRQSDEEKMRKLVTEDVPKLTGDPDFEEKIAILRQEIFQLLYGKGVTAQMREDFLVRYGCTGFNDVILQRLVALFATRGLVEVGAGHGQWQKALTDAFVAAHDTTGTRKTFDFVLAYDNNSNLPLNTHIYNQYTRPHHDYFGSVKRIGSTADLDRVLKSWACRGRALLLVYPTGSYALEALKMYSNASPENDTLIYVGEGRGGANADEAFFDFLETGGWVLIEILEVLRPPGDKGCEKLYILQKLREQV